MDVSHDPQFQALRAVVTGNNAAGAWPVDSRVRKVNSELGDMHPDGALATVLGSIGPMPHPIDGKQAYGYLLRWDELQHADSFIANNGRLELAPEGN